MGLFALDAGWRLGLLFLLAFAIWKGLVCSLEFYSDRRVVSWLRGDALKRLLELPSTQRRWHPSNRSRQLVLAESERLFRVSPYLAFVTGTLLSVLTVNLVASTLEIAFDASLAVYTGLWQGLAPKFASLPQPWGSRILLGAVMAVNLGRMLAIFLVPLSFLSYLVAGTLGLQVQRETVADLATGQQRGWGYARLFGPAALVALGVEAGFWHSPFNSGPKFHFDPGLFTLWLTGLTGFTWLWLSYVRSLSRFTLGLHIGRELPPRLGRIIAGSSVPLLTILYWPAGFARLAPRISRWAELVQRAPLTDPHEAFVYLVLMTGIVLALVAVAFSLAVSAVSLNFVFFRLLGGGREWPSCGLPLSLRFSLGSDCIRCREPLALWAHENADRGTARNGPAGSSL